MPSLLTTLTSLNTIKQNLDPRSFVKSITWDDILGSGWNCLVALPPFGAGLATAAAVNKIGHLFIPKIPGLHTVCSLAVRAGAFVIGANVGFLVADYMGSSLVPFSADKAIRMEFLCFIPWTSAAVLGYFGNRALCVIGAVGALAGAAIP